MYFSITFNAKPLTVLCSCLAVLRISSASSAVHRMRIADLPSACGASCGFKVVRQNSAAIAQNARRNARFQTEEASAQTWAAQCAPFRCKLSVENTLGNVSNAVHRKKPSRGLSSSRERDNIYGIPAACFRVRKATRESSCSGSSRLWMNASAITSGGHVSECIQRTFSPAA